MNVYPFTVWNPTLYSMRPELARLFAPGSLHHAVVLPSPTPVNELIALCGPGLRGDLLTASAKHARIMAAAPDMRQLLIEACEFVPAHSPLGRRMRATLKAIDERPPHD